MSEKVRALPEGEPKPMRDLRDALNQDYNDWKEHAGWLLAELVSVRAANARLEAQRDALQAELDAARELLLECHGDSGLRGPLSFKIEAFLARQEKPSGDSAR